MTSPQDIAATISFNYLMGLDPRVNTPIPPPFFRHYRCSGGENHGGLPELRNEPRAKMKWILHEKTLLLLLLFLEKANSLGSEINCDVSTFRRQLSVLLLSRPRMPS